MPTPLQASRCMVEIVALGNGMAFRKTMMVPHGQTLSWAVNASGLYALYPQLREAAIGVWGKMMAPETLVADGDRIEVYHPVNAAALVVHRAKLQALRANQNNGKVAE
jgi:uncharacterized protein